MKVNTHAGYTGSTINERVFPLSLRRMRTNCWRSLALYGLRGKCAILPEDFDTFKVNCHHVASPTDSGRMAIHTMKVEDFKVNCHHAAILTGSFQIYLDDAAGCVRKTEKLNIKVDGEYCGL